MTTPIQSTVLSLLPSGRKSSVNGWISFNAPCCIHNGESADTRGRGGINADADGSVGYHCFNCGFVTGFVPGRHLSYKFRKLLQWLGADENSIKRLVIEAIRIKDTIAPEVVEKVKEEYVVKPRPLPTEAQSFDELVTFHDLNDWENSEQLTAAVKYVHERRIDMQKYKFFLTPEKHSNLHKRVLVPIYYKGQGIGYTGRAIENNVKPKYYNSYENNVVFNLDKQLKDSKFVIVVEGTFDAMSIDGVAILSADVSETQADIIDSLGKEVIVVPDFDVKIINGKKVWSGESLVDAALEYGWNVSFPDWQHTCKDVNEAVVKYGKLFAMKSIIDAVQTSKLKIELLKKRVHS